ncbi:MAG: histidine kinase [Burkholderiaceae bacterium]|nr:histidine kinase [Burkholderiaceae bacterium]
MIIEQAGSQGTTKRLAGVPLRECMSPDSVSASTLDTVMPDYYNTGAVYRVLLAVNAVFLAACLARAQGLSAGLLLFVEISMPVELTCLISLFALGAVRHMLLKSGAMPALSPWAQRLLCALVPAAIAGALIRLLVALDWFRDGFGYVTPVIGMLLAALFGWALQHYFELRARAFSPALAEARLQALQARIRPHFLFNSLNAVLALIRNEPRRAEALLEDLADLFRVAMRDARAMTTLDAEIRLCRQYLSIEQARLGERLRVNWDTSGIDETDLQSGQMAALLLQPLIENAIHYGVEPALEPAQIDVQIARTLDRIEIVVANPVSGQPPPAGNQMALGNIRERLTLLYDVEAQFEYGAKDGRFVVRLSYPFARGAA